MVSTEGAVGKRDRSGIGVDSATAGVVSDRFISADRTASDRHRAKVIENRTTIIQCAVAGKRCFVDYKFSGFVSDSAAITGNAASDDQSIKRDDLTSRRSDVQYARIIVKLGSAVTG